VVPISHISTIVIVVALLHPPAIYRDHYGSSVWTPEFEKGIEKKKKVM